MDLRKLADMTPGMAASPLPQVEINSTHASGLKGPKGTSPRQNYSRSNTGVIPLPDAGASDQKSMSPMGATMLPAKTASEKSMGTITTPTLQDMIKSATAGALSRVKLAEEAARQQSNFGEKTAGEKCSSCGECHEGSCKKEKKASSSISTEYVNTLANACEYAAPFVKHAAQAVGEGPGALTVMEAKADKPLPQHKGQAHTQIPISTPLQSAVSPGAKTQLENTAHHAVSGTQQSALSGGKGKLAEARTHKYDKEKDKTAAPLNLIRKQASDEKLEKEETKGMAQAEKGLAKAEAAHKEEKDEKKEASLVDRLMGIKKTAEDAINPAHISAGKAVPPETSESGQPGGNPVGGAPQGPTSLIGSNESAINYNKNQAKAPSKSEMKSYVNEPALTGSTDSVLRDAFEHSSAKDNNKMASVEGATKTAAARALLAKLAEAAQEKISSQS